MIQRSHFRASRGSFHVQNIRRSEKRAGLKKTLLCFDPLFSSPSRINMYDVVRLELCPHNCNDLHVFIVVSDVPRSEDEIILMLKYCARNNIWVLISKKDQIKVVFSGPALLLVNHTWAKAQMITQNHDADTHLNQSEANSTFWFCSLLGSTTPCSSFVGSSTFRHW